MAMNKDDRQQSDSKESRGQDPKSRIESPGKSGSESSRSARGPGPDKGTQSGEGRQTRDRYDEEVSNPSSPPSQKRDNK